MRHTARGKTRLRARVASMALLVAFGVWTAGASPCVALAAQDAPGSEEGAPPDDLVPYLGTWVYVETVEAPSGPPVTVEHYMLLKWQNGKLKVKTVDYMPERRIWGRESGWNGQIRVDQWNITKQTFTPMEDGTISVGFSGTNGVGQATTQAWWAAGRLTWKEDEAGELLHLVTTVGYSPSSKGNAWKPVDQKYRRISREVDPRIERKQRR